MLCQVISAEWAFTFLRTEAFGKSFINDWDKQMHALFCSGYESVSICSVSEWFDLLWLNIVLQLWAEKASLIRSER